MDKIKLKGPLFTIMASVPLSPQTRNILLKNPSSLERVLKKPIDTIGWSKRLANIFKKTNIITIGDIIYRLRGDRLLNYRNFGRKCYVEVMKNIAESIREYAMLPDTSDSITTTMEENKQKITPLLATITSLIVLDAQTNDAFLNNPSLLENFLEKPVQSIYWSVRVTNVFEEANITKIEHIIRALPGNGLFKYRNFGKKCHKEVIEKVRRSLNKYFAFLDLSKTTRTGMKENKQKVVPLMKGVLGQICSNNINQLLNSTMVEQKIDEFLKTPIEAIDWSVRSLNVFREVRVRIMYDFSELEAYELLIIRNFGKKCLAELYTKLGDFIDLFFDIKNGLPKDATNIKSSRSVEPCDLEGFAKYAPVTPVKITIPTV